MFTYSPPLHRFKEAFGCHASEVCLGLDRLFAVIDKDGTGSIGVEDYIMAMDLLCHGTARAKSDFAFAVYDSNKMGVISANEMRDITRSILDVIKKAYTDSGNSERGGLTLDANPDAFDDMVESMVTSAFRS